MRIVADENLDLTVVGRLREAGHEVFAVVEMEPGIPDEAVLGLANSQEAMLVTEDKDFGELAFRQRLVHQGAILLRLAGLPPVTKAAMLIDMLDAHQAELPGSFAVVSPGLLRIRRQPVD
jgi:predicted nuclease of predicted toxin-antitoxin system